MKADKIAETSGVYLFKDKRGEIIYIGKALNLKKRVKSYFQKEILEFKTRRLIKEIKKIETIKTESGFEALLLEGKLIKKHQPKYNTRWRDDKRPLYIKISAEEFPKVSTARGEDDLPAGRQGKTSTYFGPFPSAKIVRNTLKFLRKIFPFCSNKKLGKKPCFYSHLKLCHPCPNFIINNQNKEKIKLKRKYLANIKSLKAVLSGKSGLVIKKLKREMLLKAKEMRFEGAQKIKEQIKQLEYLATPRLSVAEYLKNPNLYEDLRLKELKDLYRFLKPQVTGLKFPKKIEGYDISNIAGKQASGSMVVFIDGQPEKSQYRKFKIKLKERPDDIAMIKEVLRRRLHHKDWLLPNIIVVDGGKGQVTAALNALEKLDLKIPVLGLAKKLEEIIIFSQGKFLKLKLKKRSPALQLLQKVRDEAHRFAKRYHLFLRKKNMLYST